MSPGPWLKLQQPADFWAVFHRSDDGCLLWQGPVGPYGYGRCTYDHVRWGTHRLAYTLAYGPIPPGFDVCHSCDVRLCGEPSHLFTGRHIRDNSLDMWQKGRAHPRWQFSDGRGHHAKLSVAQVREMRQLHRDGQGYRKLARRFSLAKSTIARIVTYDTWQWVD